MLSFAVIPKVSTQWELNDWHSQQKAALGYKISAHGAIRLVLEKGEQKDS